MAVTDAQRHALGVRARKTLGTDEGATLMEMLPPVGWADVARRSDLQHLESSLRLEVRAEIRSEVNRLIMWLAPMNIGLALAAAGLT